VQVITTIRYFLLYRYIELRVLPREIFRQNEIAPKTKWQNNDLFCQRPEFCQNELGKKLFPLNFTKIAGENETKYLEPNIW
jgi:hypothetical protein